MSDHLPLTALRTFEAAARHLSFRAAADELNVTPAAVSQQIKTLEELLGVKLFHRLHRGLALTESSRAALVPLQEGFARLGDGLRLLKGTAESSRINVWMAPAFAARWLLPRLERFVSEQPDTELWINASAELIDSGTSRLELSAELMRAEQIDLAIRFGHGNYPGCRVQHLMAAAVSPLCSPSLLSRKDQPLRTPADLAHHTLLHDDTPYEGRPGWEQWFEAAGVDVDARRGLHFNNLQLAMAAALDGQGVALCIEQLAADDIAAGRLVSPFSRTIELDSAYYLIAPEEREDTDAVAAFKDWLLRQVAAD